MEGYFLGSSGKREYRSSRSSRAASGAERSIFQISGPAILRRRLRLCPDSRGVGEFHR